MTEGLFVIGETDPAEVNTVFAEAQGHTAFDIGANCGQSIRRLLPGFTHVIAVEPATESFDYLREHYGDNDRVSLVQAAATDHVGEVVLEVRDVIGTGQLTTGARGELPWGERHDVRHVPATTVDQLADEFRVPDLLKVDTEGHEVLVLQGAERVLASRPQVIVEIHSHQNGLDCNDILEAAGFDVRLIRHFAYREANWGYDNHYYLVAK
jgi:FkbM family methyltransferase